MKENNFSSLNEVELTEVNGGLDPVTVVTTIAVLAFGAAVVTGGVKPTPTK